MEDIILHVMLVAFHHRNGPQVEYSCPPLPNQPKDSNTLPDEWSFMPFMCLPDGAHATEEEFIYFHLPPVDKWSEYPQQTLFGLACFRQIDAKDLLYTTADVTRTKVQKSVVVLARQPVLGSLRSKLGLVTQAFFAQRDFSKLDILDTLYENLNASIRFPFADTQLYMGFSLRELVYKFRLKTLQLVKLILLQKRILFFGHSVERLSAYQYALVSLIPELSRHLEDVGSPKLERHQIEAVEEPKLDLESAHRSDDLLRKHSVLHHKSKLYHLGHPLQVFGKGCFFQPYIPLQQIDVLMSPETTSFLAGTSNQIFTHHKQCHIDLVVHADTGEFEVINPAINPWISLTAADRKFMDDIIKSVLQTYTPDDDMNQNQQIEFQGSDDDIRARMEEYLTQFLASVSYDNRPVEEGTKKVDYLSEYNMQWVQQWKKTQGYQVWTGQHKPEYLEMINPGHPCHGFSTLGAVQSQFAARLAELGKSITPTVSRAVSTAAASATDAVNAVVDQQQQDQIQATTNQLFTNVSTWYSSKRKEWLEPKTQPGRGIQGHCLG
ncbi:transport protein Avl9-domain-containing protein [Gorgonomyces haynaldii]|nr:transport protein Avl9-domain-containing protein [Gorgonomyces haynaldii]